MKSISIRKWIDNMMNYKQALSFIEERAQKGIIPGTEAVKHLAEVLGHPERNFKIIHIAGTNGKGSIGAYLAYILDSAGYKVGRYMSPAVCSYRERIQVLENGQQIYISKNSVAEKVQKIKDVMEVFQRNGWRLPTAFEMETVMAFMEFAGQECDVAVIETGMGGTFDATNMLEQKELAVITSISFDHMKELGDTIEEITMQKAGIIIENTETVCYDYRNLFKGEDILKIINQECNMKNSKLYQADFEQIEMIDMTLDGTDFIYKGKSYHINLLGIHQPMNAVLALEACEVLQKKGWNISALAIEKGFCHTKWHARFEVVCEKPFIVIDGAHNEEAACTLKKTMDVYFQDKKIIFIVGVLADKEYDKILKVTAPAAKKIITIQPDNDRALASEELEKIAKNYCQNVISLGTIERALDYAEKLEDDIVVVFGSLSFMGSLYQHLNHKSLLVEQ